MSLSRQCDDFGRGPAHWYKGGNDTDHPAAVFLGANGHTIDTYRFFTDQLCRQLNLFALDNRAVWPDSKPPVRQDSFDGFAHDYLHFLDFIKPDTEPVIHIGHSLGASVGVLAAIQQPQRFSHLIIIEPGTTPNWLTHLGFRTLPQKARRQIGFIKRTAKRRSQWPSQEAFMQQMREKRLYAGFSEQAMRDYARGGLKQVEGHYQLRFSPQWESHIFTSVRYIWPLVLQLTVPTLILRAEHSNYVSSFIFNSYRRAARYVNRRISFREIPDAGHLVIQDAPDAVLTIINKWLAAKR